MGGVDEMPGDRGVEADVDQLEDEFELCLVERTGYLLATYDDSCACSRYCDPTGTYDELIAVSDSLKWLFEDRDVRVLLDWRQ